MPAFSEFVLNPCIIRMSLSLKLIFERQKNIISSNYFDPNRAISKTVLNAAFYTE